jgi:geranylgeranyl diphosphate synthase type II
MDFETAEDVSIASYLEMIRLKTAVLLGAAFELGALAAGAPPDDQQRLYRFGVHTGMVFQLRDDLLDTYGDAELFGKKQYGDIVANKKTYLYLKTLESLGQRDRSRLIALYSGPTANPEKKVRQVLKYFDSVDVKKHTEEEIILHYHNAQHCLEDIDLPESKKKGISDYTEGLMGRKY